MKYYTITVELYIDANSEKDAFNIVENHIDDIVSNNNEMQDYFIHKNIIEEIVE